MVLIAAVVIHRLDRSTEQRGIDTMPLQLNDVILLSVGPMHRTPSMMWGEKS